MNRQRLQRFSRKWHRVLAPILGIQLFLWTLGGIYFSWLDLDNVHGDYERADPVVLDLRDLSDVAPIERILKESALGRVEEIRIGSFLDRSVIRLYETADRVEMYDAGTGERLSPITEAQARRVADDDFAPEANIVAVRLIEEKGGEYKNAVPAYRVDFDNWKRTHVYVNADTGLAMARRNAIWRGFDFLWMLHILDFEERENFNNWLLRAVSVLGMITVLSGYALWALTAPIFRSKRMPPPE
jgi:uncharacterized iron-regulated membrane protein